ncbi:hypothetical protein [Fusibacter sp. 3D3]|uniref:hypothetical protein n=1 Tax=Fusibacter sp. 3D3 TaxID=1048380 RepID=UPI0008534F2B|nr:hypothetical protein [Fusibacter sp. 3D3]GAU80009.1 hypothetical protein F3D3_4675 [Fusibacter sp. 3D3]
MKYNLVKIGTIAMFIFILSGCAVNNPPKEAEGSDANSASQEEVINQEEASDEEVQQVKSPLIQNLENLLLDDADSVMVAAYVQDHIKEASPEEADQMIEILLQMQTALIQKSHEGLLYDSAYMEALNNTMGGVLDPEKINEIENEAVRSFYQSVVDSELTMVRYEETPVLETNWESIQAYQATFTEPFQMVIDFQDYNNLLRAEDVEDLVNRVYAMEEMLLKSSNGFAKSELTELYSTYVSRILAGPEGSYLYRLGDASDDYYKKMVVAIEGHEKSGFAKETQVMMAEETKTFNHLIDIVDAYRSNNPYGEHRWEKSVKEEGDVKVVTLSYEGEDASVSKRINAILQSAKAELIESLGASNYQIDMYKAYQSGDYATIQIYINYIAEDGQAEYDEKAVNLDLKNGILLTLNTLLKSGEDGLLDEVNTLAESDFETIPNFSLTTTGLLLTEPKESSPNIDHAVITMDQLLKNKQHKK